MAAFGMLNRVSMPKQGPAFKPCTMRKSIVTRFSVAGDTYICMGLAHCFEKSEDGKLVERLVIEPISAASLECMANGGRTSFKVATGLLFADAIKKERSLLPEEFSTANFCEKFEYRCEAAARTWTRPHAQDNLMDIVPIGNIKKNFNFCIEDKRVLNLENVVTDEDNIKQDLSIDVYGRKKDEAEAQVAAEQKQAEEASKQEDDLDALLLA